MLSYSDPVCSCQSLVSLCHRAARSGQLCCHVYVWARRQLSQGYCPSHNGADTCGNFSSRMPPSHPSFRWRPKLLAFPFSWCPWRFWNNGPSIGILFWYMMRHACTCKWSFKLHSLNMWAAGTVVIIFACETPASFAAKELVGFAGLLGYFWNAGGTFDFVIVVASLAALISGRFPNLNMARIFRQATVSWDPPGLLACWLHPCMGLALLKQQTISNCTLQDLVACDVWLLLSIFNRFYLAVASQDPKTTENDRARNLCHF